jgi:putative ABC transport system permease protein
LSIILWLSSLRYLMRHPWQVGLAVLGVSLGVAVVVSIDLANQSAKRAFALSTEAVAGRATHTITGGPGGLAEDLYRRLRVEAGVRTVAPVVEGYASLPAEDLKSLKEIPGRRFQLLGIDPFAEMPFRPYLSDTASPDIRALVTRPGAALISSDTARLLGVSPGDTLELSVGGIQHDIQLVGLIDPGDEVSREALADLLVADIATAQEVLGVSGRLSRIDVVLPEGESAGPVLERICAVLPPGVDIERSSARSESVDQLTRAFEVNLTAMSLLALLVGTFLIYNTMTFSVVRRRQLIGTLRAIGVTRSEIFTLVLGEAFLIGLVSAVFGVLLGILLGRGLMNIVTQTINDLFFVVSVRELTIPVFVLLKGGLLGIFAALVAAIFPALEATSVTSRAAMARSTIETRLRRLIPRATAVGTLVLAIGMGLLLMPTKSLLVSFGGLCGLLLGFALLIPLITVLFFKVLAPLARRPFGMMGFMAARGTSASFSRTAVAITALTVAVSITVGIGTMVQSFRGTVDRWLETSLGADIYVSPPSPLSSRVEATIFPAVLDRLVTVPGIVGASSFRGAEVESPGGSVQLVALGTEFETFNRPERFKEGNPSEIWDGFQRGDTVIVSEPYAFHNGLDVGSSVRLLTAQGERDFRVAGIYFDYSSSKGVVMMSRNAYQSFWNDDGISSVSLYIAPGQDVDALIERLYQVAGDEQELRIRSNLDLREASLEIFDRSFTITSVLRVLAMIVAFVGVLSALMALQLERSRELGTLRAMGFTPSQIWRMITSQTGLMGLIAGLLSLPMGLALAAGLIFVVNRRSFGWSMDMQIFPIVLIEAIALALVAALLAGIYPAIRMAMSSPAEALREE